MLVSTKNVASTVKRIRTSGTPMAIQRKKPMCVPVMRSMSPIPIRFGGVPTGVAIPPTEAPNEVMSIITVANLRSASSCPADPLRNCATIDTPIGNIIAVVAVLLIHIEMTVPTRP